VQVGVTKVVGWTRSREGQRRGQSPPVVEEARRPGTEVCPEDVITGDCVTALASEEKQGHKDKMSRTQGQTSESS